MKSNVRWLATQALHQVLTEERSLNRVVPKFQRNLNARDQALLQELCYGSCRQLHHMQFWVKHLLSKPLKTRDHDVLALIYIGLYQLLYTRIPDHAAIAETVAVTARLQKPWAKGLLNGVLRNVQRLRQQIPEDWIKDPIYRFSHPKWLIKQLQEAWPDQWQSILEANNHRPPMTLRINRKRLSVDDYLAKLEQLGIGAHATPYSNVGITLSQPMDVTALPGFTEGQLSVQDEAAQLAATLLDVRDGDRVLDACCAPGGKTGHLLEQAAELDSLWALDADAQRLAKVNENLQRLQLTAILKEGSAEQLESWWDGYPFDRILVDTPCSATGVIRRHPDIKLLRRKDDIAQLAELQLSILQSLWRTLKPGGNLVYATCSVLPQENEQVIAKFLTQTADAEHRVIDADWGQQRPFGRQLMPQANGHDGFYYAHIGKKPQSHGD